MMTARRENMPAWPVSVMIGAGRRLRRMALTRHSGPSTPPAAALKINYGRNPD
jgi:hypothetical protein